MQNRTAIINGLRTPMGKAGGVLKTVSADDLAAYAIKELLVRVPINPTDISDVIIGNVAQPTNAANVARVIALKCGLPNSIPAVTVHRNCASGMEAISSGATRILMGESDIVIAGGTESMSNIPLLFNHKMTALFDRLFRAKTLPQKLQVLASFRLSFLAPIIGVMQGLTDPISNLIMGMTAENLSREFHIDRMEQDVFALASHQKAVAAQQNGIFAQEMTPIPVPPNYDYFQEIDEGPRASQSLEALQKLPPYFDRKTGTVTVGNACPISDGAAAVILMSEEKAKSLGLTPLGYLKAWTYAGLEPERMGLGPVYATAKLLKQTGMAMKDFGLIEINEAFAAQVLACEKAFGSDKFAQTYLNQSHAVGQLNMDILNVNGGAIALGHPVGMTGTRLVITLLKEMRRRNVAVGLASLCVGGGQGASFILETAE